MRTLKWKMRAFLCTVVAVAASAAGAEISRSPDLTEAVVQCTYRIELDEAQGLPFSNLTMVGLTNLLIEASLNPAAEARKWRSQYGSCDLALKGTSYSNFFIHILSPCGGRNYVLDPRFGIYRLIYTSQDEKDSLGRWVKRYFQGELLGAELSSLYLAMPWLLGGIRNPEEDSPSRWRLACLLGDFVAIDGMDDFVLRVGFEDADADIRMGCLESIISVNLECPLPRKVAGKLSERANARLHDAQKIGDKQPLRISERERILLESIASDKELWRQLVRHAHP